uniref:EF-hand calcium-binding domain-containing protein 7 n=1 Tax=Leptobrachium leishanense TaxID=445787 RepID=A0A8C5PPS5_9ANUR
MASLYGSNASLSNQKHPSSDRDERKKAQASEEELFYASCRAAYLTVFKSSLDSITSREQLCLVLQHAGRNPTNKILSKYWTARTRELHFDDFCIILKKEKAATKTELLKAFKKIDLESKGYIFHDTLSGILAGKGEKMSPDEVRTVLQLTDVNSNGRLDYNKFCDRFLEVCDQCTKTASDRMESDNKAKRQQFGSQTDKSPERSQSPLSKPRASRSDLDTTPKKAESKSPRISSARSSKATVSTVVNMVAADTKTSKLAEPTNLQDWNFALSKGCFFLEENGDVTSHHYKMHVPQKTSVFIKIKPYNLSKKEGKPSPWMSVDTALYILKERDGLADPQLVAFTEQRYKEIFTWKGELGPGVYYLIPFTTGCRLKKKRKPSTKDAPLVYRDRKEDLVLTPEFRSTLSDMFDVIDLDGNGFLNLEEYNFFELRTSGEKCDEDAWEVCKENFEMSKSELTRQGFMDLNLMEANDREGDPSDLWVTLQTMGYSKALEMTEACPFVIEAYAEKCKPTFKAVSLESSNKQLHKAVCRSVMQKGDAKTVDSYEDVIIYTYKSDARISSVIENKSDSKVIVQINNEQSKNCMSSRSLNVFAVEVPAKATMISQHVMPMNERQDWMYSCVQSIVG